MAGAEGTRPHPRGPTASPWAAALHPVVGLTDKAVNWWAADILWGLA